MSSTKSRITALDGIRGFAIFLVILNHFKFETDGFKMNFLAESLWNTFILAGPLGVNIFFILCGFLMTFLYPTVDKPLNFIQKRYYRIFPLFLGVCTYSIISFRWLYMPLELRLVTLLGIAGLIYYGWTYLMNKHASGVFRKIFFGFIILQLVIIVVNLFVGRLSQEEFNNLPLITQYPIIYFANLTLTLFAGWNIPILSGPYWSLAPEVLFYIVYPLIVVKLTSKIKKINLPMIVIIFVSSAIGIMMLNEIFNHVLALSRLNIVRSYAFVVGIVLALLYRNETQWKGISRTMKNRLMDVAVFFLVPVSMFIFQFFPEKNQFTFNIFHIIYNSLMLFVFMSTLIEGTISHRFFNNKILLFLGMISYSAYVIHSPALEAIKFMFSQDTWPGISANLIVGLLLTVILGYIIHVLLERPYFKMREKIDFHVSRR